MSERCIHLRTIGGFRCGLRLCRPEDLPAACEGCSKLARGDRGLDGDAAVRPRGRPCWMGKIEVLGDWRLSKRLWSLAIRFAPPSRPFAGQRAPLQRTGGIR